MEVVLDRGTEFMAEFTEIIQRDYGVTKRLIIAQNLQANGIVERIHQTIGNMLRTFRLHSTELDKEDPWLGILGAVMFATRATIHSTSRAMPAQLVDLRRQSNASRTAAVLSVTPGYDLRHVQARSYIRVTYVTRKCQQRVSVV